MQLTKEGFEELFQSNDKALERALIVLFARQTDDERRSQSTKHENGVGFTGFDAKFLSSLALQVRAGRGLSLGQRRALRKKNKRGFSMLTKYWGQLNEEVQAKQERRMEAEIMLLEAA